MKTLQNTIKIAVGVFLLAAVVVSCVPEQQSMGGAGQTIVKLFPAEFKLVPFNAVATAQSGVLFEIRRDVHSKAALNSTTSVELKYDADTAILKKYNAAHATSFIPLPPALGTVSPAITGGKVTVEFAAGDFSKSVSVNIPNANNFDFSKSYALAFKVNTVTGTGVLSQEVLDTVVVQVLVKNKYDGKYKMKGFIMRPGDLTGLEGNFKDQNYVGGTSGATSIKLNRLQCWANGSNVGGIGLWTINVIETGTPPYNITISDPVAVNFTMDATYPNRYDPATKTFYFKVNWGTAVPFNRGCTDTLVYVGPSK